MNTESMYTKVRDINQLFGDGYSGAMPSSICIRNGYEINCMQKHILPSGMYLYGGLSAYFARTSMVF